MKPNKIILRLALILSSFVLPPTVVDAQPVFVTYASLDLEVAQAESIYRGTVSDCAGEFIETPGGYFGGYRDDGTRRPDGFMRYTITVKVDEVLKGKPATTLEFVQKTSADDKRFKQWAEAHTSFLWLIGGPGWSNLGGGGLQANAPHWYTIRLGDAVSSEHGYTSDPPVYLMDFMLLTDPKEMLAHARRFAKLPVEEPIRSHKFGTIPNGPIWSSLLVPVQPRLEKIARQLIATPEDFAHGKEYGTNPEFRWGLRDEGVNALCYFKSAANIKLLKSLLSDSVSFLAERDNATFRQYPIRSKAYEVLTSWSVCVAKPIVEGEVQAPNGEESKEKEAVCPCWPTRRFLARHVRAHR